MACAEELLSFPDLGPLTAKRADAAADTSQLACRAGAQRRRKPEIDGHVYALFGLTPVEIALVEGKTAKS